MKDSGSAPISVVMPVRDGARFLRQSLNDILPAIRTTDEIVVVDDGSEDATAKVLAQFSERDDRLRVIRLRPTGLVGALNVGLRESCHDWVARADVDDRYPSSRFEVQRSARRPGVAAIVGDYSITGPGGALGMIPCALGHPFVALSALNPQRIPHPGIMMSKAAALESGAYRPTEFPAEDLGLWLRLMRAGRFVGVPNLVVDWRMTSGSTSATRQESQRATTRDLLRAFPDSLLLQVSDDLVMQELARYSQAAYGGERTVLLLRDLLTARRRGAQVSLGCLARLPVAWPIRNARAALGLGLDMRRRRSLRAASILTP